MFEDKRKGPSEPEDVHSLMNDGDLAAVPIVVIHEEIVMEFYIWEMNHGRNPRHCAMPILSEYMNFGETVVGTGFVKYLENATGVIIID